MDRHRVPFLHTQHGHHQRALCYHPKPRHQTAMPSLPIYNDLLSPPSHHSLSASAMTFPRPYLGDFPPLLLTGPNPGSYGMMGFPSGNSYSMPADFGYSFPGGMPFPLPPLLPPSHNSFLSSRQPSDDAALHAQYQAHMDALQDRVNSFLRLKSLPDLGKPTQKSRNELQTSPDWMGVVTSLMGQGTGSNTETFSDVSNPRIPILPKLHAHGNRTVDHVTSPPQRGSLSRWHSTLTPPPLHFPVVRPSSLSHPPPLHAIFERNNQDEKKRKSTGDLEMTNQTGFLSDSRVDDISNDNCPPNMPKLPPLLVGNKDLAKKLTAEGKGDVLNLSSSSKISTANAKCQLAFDSPDFDRNRITVDHCAREPTDRRSQNFTKNQSPNDPDQTNALLRNTGFLRDVAESEHLNQSRFQHPGGNRPQDPVKSSRSSCSTASYYSSLQPYISNCLTDVEAMRNAYMSGNACDGSLSSVRCREGEAAARFSPPPRPPPPLGFRGKGCFGVKRRRLVSPPGAQHSAASFPRPFPPFLTEFSRIWDWSGVNASTSSDCGARGKASASEVESASGSDLYRPGHVALASNMDEGSVECEQQWIHIKEEAMDSDPIDCASYTGNVNDSFSLLDTDRAVSRDEGQPVASTVDPRGFDRHGRNDLDQSHLQEENTTVSSFLNVPFVTSAKNLVSSELDLSSNSAARPRLSSSPSLASIERRMSDAGDDGNGEFRCHLCNYNGRSQHCLNKHFRAHGQACKICRYCLKAFERPSDLVRHEERHQKRNHALADTTSNRPVQSSRFIATGKRVKRRHAWTCRQCHFSCREARKLIQHTRRAHPIFLDCQLCCMKFVSDADLASHKARCHPVGVGRLDTYCRGVLTATKLVTCEVTGEQEISVDLTVLSELPSDCSRIPEVSNVRDMQCILGKNSLNNQCSVQDLGYRNCSDPVSQAGNSSVVEPSENHLAPQFLPPSVEFLHPTAKSPKNSLNSVNAQSPKDAGYVNAAIHRPSSGLTTPPTSLTTPATDADTVVGDADKDTPVLDNTKDEVLCDKPRMLPENSPRLVDGVQLLEKLPVASVGQCNSNQNLMTASSSPPSQNSSSFSSLPQTETSPNFHATAHDKRLILTSLLTKRKPAKEKRHLYHSSAIKPTAINKKVSKSPEMKLAETVRALDNNKTISTSLQIETAKTVDNGTSTLEKSMSGATVSKKERPTNTSLKTEISTSEDGTGEANSRKVFAECNGIEKKTETYVCVRCKYSTNAKFKYQQHLKAHNGRFICKRCNKACIKSSDLYRHWVTHNVKGPDGFFACDSCNFTSPQKYVIEDHMKQHYTLHPEQPQRQLSLMSRCGICQKNVLRSRLFEHKRVVHGKFFLKPRIDAKSGRIETDANGNSIKASLKVFACPQCDRKFTTPSYLLRHHFIHHQQSNSQTKVEENACSCRFCGVKFEDVDRLQDHEINHILQTCTDAEYVKRCHKRKKRLSVNSEHSSPVTLDSTKSPKKSPNRRKLSCPLCKKPFKLQYFLDQHMRIHSGERPFVCQQCGAGFAIFQLLNIHRRFKCPHQKTFPPTEKPPLTSRNPNTSDDAISTALTSSDCGRVLMNVSVCATDSCDRKDCVSTTMRVEQMVEVSG